MAKKRRRFVYRPPTPEQIERKRLWLRLPWKPAISQAYKRETAKLCEYLRSDLPLDEYQREQLADLIARRIQRGPGKGRKPGVIPSPLEITQRDVIAYARAQLRRDRARNGGKVPRGGHKRALEQVCQRIADDGYNVEIDPVVVLAELRRRPTRR
jgi:hypothetical protein